MEAKDLKQRVSLLVDDAVRSENWWRMQAAMQMVVGAGLDREKAVQLREAMRKCCREAQQEAGKSNHVGAGTAPEGPKAAAAAAGRKRAPGGASSDPPAPKLHGDGFTVPCEDLRPSRPLSIASCSTRAREPPRSAHSISLEGAAVGEGAARCKLFGFMACDRQTRLSCMGGG
mmetsp:Transcript_73013/g.188346  ORF Transcript_73013/g.188346 Transcript_73013/m.188346 type:complete len:173 (-) Transcript_73013:26-544(-)